MDDNLETPTAHLHKIPLGDQPAEENDEQSSDEEDGGLDWTKLLPASARPVIPKRGEKDYEPRAGGAGGGTNLQLHILDRARAAMFETLRTTRTISSKAVSYGTWHPNLARTSVSVARGIHFSTMGHSAPRPIAEENGATKLQKRLELLPEEAIYLIERGALFCWKQTDLNIKEIPGLSEVVEGAPMSVQQAYSEMIGREDLTLEKFQVYAYLKRLGYVVTRANPPDSNYPTPPPRLQETSSLSIMQRISRVFSTCISTIARTLFGGFNWWHPVGISRWLHHDKNYVSLFKSLRFIPSGHSVPLQASAFTAQDRETTPYRIFYNVYKPSTPFKKSAPPQPDFQLVVINGRTTPMPTIQELTDLFDVLPEAPLPTPRQKRPLPGAPVSAPAPAKPTAAVAPAERSLLQKLFPWFFKTQVPDSGVPARRVNPFVALKSGKKIVIIAVVDASNTSFFRFGQGEFTEWPMV